MYIPSSFPTSNSDLSWSAFSYSIEYWEWVPCVWYVFIYYYNSNPTVRCGYISISTPQNWGLVY